MPSCYSTPQIYDVMVQEDGQDFAVHHIMAFYDMVLDLESSQRSFLKRFLMEAMIQQLSFGFLSSRLSQKQPHS